MPIRRPSLSPPPARRERGSAQAGFTIIEVLATALIVALLGVGISSALVTQTHAGSDQQLRSEANVLVNQDQDRLRGMTDQALSGLASQGTSSRTMTAAGTTYTVTSSAAYQSSSGGSSCASNAIDYFKISSQVSWTDTFGSATQTSSADSLLARPVTGVLQTVVDNQLGAPISGASVTATPTGATAGSGQSGSTDSSGCSLFAGLPAGTYTVTASDSGYVNSSDQSSPSNNVSVTANGTNATNSFALGLAGSVAATFKASTSGAAPTYPGQADSLSYQGGAAYAPVLTQTATAVATHATSLLAGQTSITTTTSLYPWFSGSSSSPSYTGNYSDYAGQCTFQNPNASGNVATVSPGGAATATVQEPFLYLPTVTYGVGGVTVTPRDIVLTYSNGSCTDQYSATVAPGTGGASYLGLNYLQTPPSTGWLTDPGQPYAPTGDLTICADTSYAGGFQSGSIVIGNTNMSGQNTVPAIAITQTGACPGITS